MHTAPKKHEIVEFLISIAESLHHYGAAAHHIEAALTGLSNRFCEKGEFFVTPTSLICSFKFADEWVTRLKRVEPGGIDLGKLAEVDAIGDRVIRAEIGLEQGTRLIQDLADEKDSRLWLLAKWLSFAVASAGFCGFFFGSWYEMAATGAISSLIWLVVLLSAKTKLFGSMQEFVIAVLVALLSFTVLQFVPQVNPEKILLSSLIVLLPGLSFTVALSEIATKNWMAGTSRLMGAGAELSKIAFGAVFGSLFALSALNIEVATLTNAIPTEHVIPEPVLLVPSALAFAILFSNQPKDYLWVILAATLAYYSAKWGGSVFAKELGVFWGGATLAALSNIFARVFQRPALTLLLPGLIPMVPGSVGYRSITAVFRHDVNLTMEMTLNLVIVGIALVSGLSFGNLLVHPRRSL
ncbi:MAG: threonine/serine exporter family protein [Pseudobacteriovorax sp.]|nr:threonine/serine exporter family protein [Pseudobacteriovorax sp.]